MGSKVKMLSLTLRNFRKFATAEFKFDQQLSLISGKSGQGKTTIFMAIIFALTGEGKKLPMYGKTSCSVTLVMSHAGETVTVVRTKRPNRLRVTVSDKPTLEDKEAQAVIDDLFPQYHMGYMSQRTDSGKSFILMTPMDKMRYIEQMAFGGENVDKLINNCKELVKGRKNELMLSTRQRETSEKMLKDLKIDKIDKTDCALDENEYDDRISQHERSLDSLKTKLIKTENLIKMKEDVASRLAKMPQIEENIDDLEDELQRINTHKQGWERYQRERNKLKKLNEPSGMSKEEIKSMIQDMKAMIELESEVRSLNSCRSKVDKLSKQIEDSMVHMTCPSCETEVAMWCNKLIIPAVKGVTVGDEERAALTPEEAKRLEERRMKTKLRVEELEKKLVELEKLRGEYPELDDAQVQLDGLFRTKSNDELYAKQKALCASLKMDRPDYDDTTESLLRKKKVLYERREKEETLAGIVIKHDPDELTANIETLTETMRRLAELKRSAQSVRCWNAVEALIKTEADLNMSYPRAVKLQEIIKTAEKMAVTEVIEEINLHAQMYLDSFIEDINVMLAFDGVKLNVEVTQDGHDSDLQNLSGGELARVILAFTIALAEINNVKLLLLDECVASLDQESTGQVIEAIKTNFNGTVICIAHQTTTGVFDHVLEL